MLQPKIDRENGVMRMFAGKTAIGTMRIALAVLMVCGTAIAQARYDVVTHGGAIVPGVAPGRALVGPAPQ
jgi:hypothetical protein